MSLYNCPGCGDEHPGLYSVKDELWLHHVHKEWRRSHLCLACFEKLLGREIQLDDLKNVPVNHLAFKFGKRGGA